MWTVFGMNVGGVPWTGQDDPELKDGFRNVVVICMAMLAIVLLCFLFPGLYSHIMAWQIKRALKRSCSFNPFITRTRAGGGGGYFRI